jgi:hypothetical protein
VRRSESATVDDRVSGTTRRKSPKRQESFVTGVGRDVRRAARTAREVARRYGTPQRASLRWESYEPLAANRELSVLVEEIDRDPHGCFFG